MPNHAIPLPADVMPGSVPTEGDAMDLTIWLPALLLLGLVFVGLMFLFVEACDKV